MQTVGHMPGSWAAGPVDNRKEYSSREGGRLAHMQTSQERDKRALPLFSTLENELLDRCMHYGQLLLDLNNSIWDKPQDTYTISPLKADTDPRPATEDIVPAKNSTDSNASIKMLIPHGGGGTIPSQSVQVKQRWCKTDSNVGWGHLVFLNKSNHIS